MQNLNSGEINFPHQNQTKIVGLNYSTLKIPINF